MPESWFEKIERYLGNSMTDDEKSKFESELLVNSELAVDFEMYKMIEEEMHDFEKDRQGEEALKDSLKEISASFVGSGREEGLPNAEKKKDPNAEKEKDHSPLRAVQPSSRRPGRISSLQQFAVAAAIIGIIALGVTWYFMNGKENSIAINKKPGSLQNKKHDSVDSLENKPEDLANEKDKNKQEQKFNNTKQETLYALNFKRDKTPEIKDEFLADAYSYYDNGEYKNAIKAFDNADLTIVSRGNETDTLLRKFYAHYYKAQSYMVTNNFKNAIVELKGAIDQNIDSLKIKAQWYLALAYLKKGDLKKTDSLLAIVAANKIKPEYKLKAQTVINNLGKDKQ